MKWVKASERLPEKCGKENTVIIRSVKFGWVTDGFRNFDKDNPALYFILGSRSFLTVQGWGNGNSTYSIESIEWLDESEPPAPIPADITKWIEENYSFLAIDYFKDENKHEVVFDLGWMRIFKGGMITMYNLLQSKMQEQEKQIESLVNENHIYVNAIENLHSQVDYWKQKHRCTEANLKDEINKLFSRLEK